jgi:predicted transcriptional regulator
MSAESAETVFDILSDPDCRAIVRTVDEPMTAREVATHCDLPLSTAYRKLDTLAATPLVERSYRLRKRGKHPKQYHRQVDSLLVDLPEDRIEVQFLQDVTVG